MQKQKQHISAGCTADDFNLIFRLSCPKLKCKEQEYIWQVNVPSGGNVR